MTALPERYCSRNVGVRQLNGGDDGRAG